jgi:hypothetical protein
MLENHGDITGPSISDDAKRASDIVNGYYAYVKWEELKNNWVAIRLTDGGSDGNRYLSKRDAVRHQSDEFVCAYVSLRNCPNGISPLEMERFLAFTRGAYDAGMRLPDPDAMDGGKDPFMDVSQYDRLRGIVNGSRY